MNLEKLFTKSNDKLNQQHIVNLVLNTKRNIDFIQYLLNVNDINDINQLTLMIRIQFFISKINNKTDS